MIKIFSRQCLLILFCLLATNVVWAQENADLPGENLALTGDIAKRAEAPIPEGADQFQRCVLYHQRGYANGRLGRYDQAVADLRQALALNQLNFRSPDLWCSRWRVSTDLSIALASAGDQLGQIEVLKQVGNEMRNLDSRRYFFSQLFLVTPYAGLLMLKDADAAFQRATDLLPQLKQRKDWASESHNILNQYATYAAYLQELRGNLVEGERLRRDALKNAEAYRELKESTMQPGNQIIRVAKTIQTVAYRQLADNLAMQNKLGEAEYYARRALNSMLTYSAFNTREVAGAVAALGLIKLQQGQLPAAEKLYRQALQAIEATDVKQWSIQLAGLRSRLAFTIAAQKRWQEAEDIFRARDAALRSNPEQYAKFSGRNIEWALVQARIGKPAEGVAMLEHLIAHRKKALFADPLEVAQFHGYLGVVLTANGQPELALPHYQQALPVLLKRAADDAGSDSSGFFSVYRLRTILEGYLELLADMHAKGKQVAGLDPVAEAFRMADIARGSSVQRAVMASAARANLPDPALADLARREQDTAARIQSLSKVLIRLASSPEGARLEKVIAEMQRDIAHLEGEQLGMRKELEQRFPDYANLINPKPASPADLQAVLQAGEAVLAFYIAEKQTYLWVMNGQTVVFRVLPYKWNDAVADTVALRRGLDLSEGYVKDFDFSTAHKVYRHLLAQDAALWGSAKVLNVIPHGPLAQVPFSVLLTDQPRKGKPAEQPWLMLKLAVVQQPSSGALIALRRAPVRAGNDFSFIGFGDPLFAEGVAAPAGKVRSLRLLATPERKDAVNALRAGEKTKVSDDATPVAGRVFSLLSPLPDTAQELSEIAGVVKADSVRDIFIGKRASEGNLKKADLKRYRIVAFATHGLTPGELPELDQPALAMANPTLSGDSENDGLLTLEEVLALKLDADWVVLSACNTAGADGVSGEAISGLGRGFFFAGTRSLLVSNWAVETVSARLLTTGLFRQQAAAPQMGRAEALQAAMQAVMRDSSGKYGHPAFWAPFSVVGDGMR